MITIETFVAILDLGGTFVFAISGALAAVNRRLDIFGILVLSFVAGNFGGITRDVLIGAVPPAALSDRRYLLVSVLAGLVTFFSYAGVDRLRSPVLLFDAVGLAFFAVAGAQKAITFGLSPVMAALLGMLTGIGGGMTRDILLTEIPQVLRSDLYAVAALVGASIVVIGDSSVFPMEPQLWSEVSCALASASWQSDMVGICRSLIFPRKNAWERTLRTKRNRTEIVVHRRGAVWPC